MASPRFKPGVPSGSAVFMSPEETYHADRCEPLRQAVRQGEVSLLALARRGYPGRRLPEGMLPEVSTIGYWDATGPQSWGLDWHRNEGIEITYLARGQTAFQVESEQFTLESGQLTITRPWQSHRVGDPKVGSSRLHWLILDVGVRRPDQAWRWPNWLILSRQDLNRLTRLLSHNEQPVWQANPEIGSCFDRLTSLMQARNLNAVQSRLQLHINELLITLRELLEEKQVRLNPQLASTRRMVGLFLQGLPRHLDHPWTLPEMAAQCGLHSSAFADYCRRITNLTPAQFLIRCRIDAAKQLLVNEPGRSITDIALACGFESSQYLATVFRDKTGLSPRDYRRTAQGKA